MPKKSSPLYKRNSVVTRSGFRFGLKGLQLFPSSSQNLKACCKKNLGTGLLPWMKSKAVWTFIPDLQTVIPVAQQWPKISSNWCALRALRDLSCKLASSAAAPLGLEIGSTYFIRINTKYMSESLLYMICKQTSRDYDTVRDWSSVTEVHPCLLQTRHLIQLLNIAGANLQICIWI